MTRHYGVVCKTRNEGLPCKTVFSFDTVSELLENQIEFPCPPLEGLMCPKCRKTHSYGSDDVLEFVLLDPAESI